jgi:hypothetical protein
LKSFKPFLKKIFADEYGYMVTIFSLMAIDDTVLTCKIVVQEFISSLSELILSDEGANDFAVKILLYLISGELKGSYFPQYSVQIINEALEKSQQFTKKDAVTKHKELYDYIKDDLDKFIEKNMSKLMRNPKTNMILTEYLILNKESDVFCKIIEEELNSEEFESEENVLKSADCSRLFKKWISLSPKIGRVILKYCGPHVSEMVKSDGIYIIVTLTVNMPSEMKKVLKPLKKSIEKAYGKNGDKKLKMLIDAI